MRPSAFSSWGDHSDVQHEAPTLLRSSQAPEATSHRGYLLGSLTTNLSVSGAQGKNLGWGQGCDQEVPLSQERGAKEIRESHKRGACSCVCSSNRHGQSCSTPLGSADSAPFRLTRRH